MSFIPRREDHTTPERPSSWRDEAACVGWNPELFFPVAEKGVPASLKTRPAKEVCGACPVVAECLAHALQRPEEYGVWGGLDEYERADLLRKARVAAEESYRRAKERADATCS
ncbi:WhiB family transcriptional regulator [Streptomyces cinereoruber]|uniref:WhiB family transcriptional regulator n=1 Tax=Streptomyces cinereoruber TaxID=67260 RepID=UPI003C2B4B06